MATPEPEQLEPNLFQRAGRHIQNRILAGFVELLPMIVTVIVILFIVSYVDGMFRPLLVRVGMDFFPGLGVILSCIFLYLVGILISTEFGSRVTALVSETLSRIPIVKGVFGVARQAMSALTVQNAFTRVVFIEWPREGMIAIGFVTARVHAPGREESLIMVYIPTIPNPTSGNMAVVVEDDVFETDLSVDDAMRLVFSGGIVPPDVLSLARLPGAPQRGIEFIGQFKSERKPPSQ